MRLLAVLVCAVGMWAQAQTFSLEGKVTYIATANIETWQGTAPISAKELKWDSDTDTVSGKLCLEVGRFDSGNFIRDGNGRSLIQTDKFPQACLQLSRLLWASNGKDVVLEGTLEFRGRKKEVKIAGQMTPQGSGYSFVGSLRTSFSEWGMVPPRLLVLIANDPIELRLEAKLSQR